MLLTLKRQGKVVQTVVEAISPQQETMLRYSHWVQNNKQQVDTLSQQQLGYLHLNAMTPPDLAGFARDFCLGFAVGFRRVPPMRGDNTTRMSAKKAARRTSTLT